MIVRTLEMSKQKISTRKNIYLLYRQVIKVVANKTVSNYRPLLFMIFVFLVFFKENLAYGGIRTMDVRCQRRPRYQLCHIQGRDRIWINLPMILSMLRALLISVSVWSCHLTMNKIL